MSYVSTLFLKFFENTTLMLNNKVNYYNNFIVNM